MDPTDPYAPIDWESLEDEENTCSDDAATDALGLAVGTVGVLYGLSKFLEFVFG